MARTSHHGRTRGAAPIRHKRPRIRRTGTRGAVVRAELASTR